MKQFLNKNTLFILPLIVLLIIFEIILRSAPNEYTSKIRAFEKQLNSIEILILGSSHALRGINPHELKPKKAFNLAMVAQTIEMDHRLFFKYKDSLPKLKFIIISISQFSLTQRLIDNTDKNRLPLYKHFYKIDIDEIKPTSLHYYCVQFSIDASTKIKRIAKYLQGKTTVATDSLGWLIATDRTPKHRESLFRNALVASKRHEDMSLDFKHNIALLKEIIDYSEAHGIKVILVNTPKTSIYNELLNKSKMTKIDNEIVKLVACTRSVYVNAQHDSDFLLSDFRDSDRLNRNGAKKFTQLLNESIY